MSCENKTVTIDGQEYELVKKEPKHKARFLARADKIVFPEASFIVSDKEMTWYEAIQFAKQNRARLLTVAELHIYRIAFIKTLGNKADNYFWSSEEYPTSTLSAWSVFLGNGNTTSKPKITSYYVACVLN